MEQTTQGKRKRGIETTGRILEEAAVLFARKGFDAVPMSEIASAVGIKESSLYNHFSGKAAILDALFDVFAKDKSTSRPSDQELDMMLNIMGPEEIFKNLLIYFGNHVNPLFSHTAMIVTNEKYKNEKAADMYYRYVVKDSVDYYERLINKMIDKGLVKKVDARRFAEQYNYSYIALTKEYFMAENGLADKHSVIVSMVEATNFFCELMKK
jgi:AcrR family transcriptional regulator